MKKELKINLGNHSISLTEDDFIKGVSLAGVDGKEVNMDMTVDASAEYATNAREYFVQAMIGEKKTRSNFRPVLGVKDLVKLGGLTTSDIEIRPGDVEPNFDDTTAIQKEFRVAPLMAATSIKISELEQAYMSDQLAKGSNNFTDKFEFMNFLYAQVAREISKKMEKKTWTALTATDGYNGLNFQLGADDDVLVPTAGNGGVASAITSANVIDKLKQARNVITAAKDGAVAEADDFVYIVSKDVYNALADVVSENKASGLYYLEGETLAFHGVEVYKSMGAIDNTLIAAAWSNFVNIQDLLDEELGFNIVDFMKTTLSRKLGIRVDFKYLPSFVNGDEIYFHTFTA